MSKYKAGDIVSILWPRQTFIKIIAVIPVKEYGENCIFGEEYDFNTGETDKSKGLHEVWEHDVEFVDMKGANI